MPLRLIAQHRPSCCCRHAYQNDFHNPRLTSSLPSPCSVRVSSCTSDERPTGYIEQHTNMPPRARSQHRACVRGSVAAAGSARIRAPICGCAARPLMREETHFGLLTKRIDASTLLAVFDSGTTHTQQPSLSHPRTRATVCLALTLPILHTILLTDC